MTITAVSHADVDDVVRAHIAMHHVTYAHISDAAAAAMASGPGTEGGALVARGERGSVIGVVFAFEGVGAWERGLSTPGRRALDARKAGSRREGANIYYKR